VTEPVVARVAAPLPTAEVSGRTEDLRRVVRLGVLRARIELLQFWRNPQAMFFLFLLPVVLLVLFGMIFDFNVDGPPGAEPVKFRQYFVAGITATGIVSTTFATLATSISVEQHEGLLKRLAGTPLPKASYFIGKMGLALVTSVAQTAIMLTAGVLFFGITLPSDPVRWLVFAFVFVDGVVACSLIGIAYTRLISNAASAAPIVQAPFLILQFISGVYFVFTDMPPVLRAVAIVFPLKWMAQGFRYVFLPDWVKTRETNGSWEIWLVMLVLSAWTVAGFVLATRFFRWSVDEA